MAAQPIDTAENEKRRQARTEAYRNRIQDTFQLDPVVEIMLGGTAYKVEITNRAVKGIYKDTRLNLLSNRLTEADMESAEILGAILFHGLRKHHPEMTQEASDDLFDLRHYPYILNRLNAALEYFLPDLSDLPMPEEAPEGEEAAADPS